MVVESYSERANAIQRASKRNSATNQGAIGRPNHVAVDAQRLVPFLLAVGDGRVSAITGRLPLFCAATSDIHWPYLETVTQSWSLSRYTNEIESCG